MKIIKTITLSILFILILTACISCGKQTSEIPELGMSIEDVVWMWGEPDHVTVSEDSIMYTWELSYCHFGEVIFEDDKVVYVDA